MRVTIDPAEAAEVAEAAEAATTAKISQENAGRDKSETTMRMPPESNALPVIKPTVATEVVRIGLTKPEVVTVRKDLSAENTTDQKVATKRDLREVVLTVAAEVVVDIPLANSTMALPEVACVVVPESVMTRTSLTTDLAVTAVNTNLVMAPREV